MLSSPRKKFMLAVAVLVVLVGSGIAAWHYAYRSSAQAFPIESSDRISSWSFKGAYTGNDVLVAQANTDMAKLRTLLAARACTEAEASSTIAAGLTDCNAYDDYDLYIGVGNDYNLLGNGKLAYRSYNEAVAVHPDKGLAYANLGYLFEELGAYATAADAYAKATAVEPAQLEYHILRLKFLTSRFPDDSVRILSALTDANNQFGAIAEILVIKAAWQESQGKYADAIATWQEAIRISPGRDVSAMQAQIVRDRAKQ